MAKWGEGDPRWIVEQRADATNPNNWHWVEKDATKWSKDRLSELLTQNNIEKGAIKVNLQDFRKIEGDATANNRKAKLIFLFDWVIEINFIANISGHETEYKGYVEIPNLSDENEANEIEMNINIDTRGPLEDDVRRMLDNEGLQFVRKQCGVYLRELKEQFGKDLILPTNGNDKSSNSQSQATSNKTSINKQSFQSYNTTSAPSSEVKKDYTISSNKLTLVETYKVPPERLYEILTQKEIVKVWSGGGSVIDASPGGKFILMNGQVSGVFLSLTPDNEFVMKWRMKTYPEGHYATVKFRLVDKSDSTDLHIEAEAVPEDLYEETKQGFSRYYMQNIGKTFGIGLGLF